MIRVLEGQNFPDTASFVAALNKARLANRQKWIVYIGEVAGVNVELKSFDHGDLQILRADGRDIRMREYGLNVGAWKSEIANNIDKFISRRKESV